MMNTNLLNSGKIKENFILIPISLKFGKSTKELESFSIIKVFKAFKYLFLISYKLLTQKCDIVLFTITPTGYGFFRDAIYVFIIKRFRNPLILHLHGKGIQSTIHGNLNRLLYSSVFKNTSVICLSERLASDINNVYSKKPYIVPNGIASGFKTTRTEDKHENEVVELLFVSNLIRNKGILVLIDALYILKTNGIDFKAKFIGSPSNITFEMLTTILKEKELFSYCTIMGPLYDNDKFKEFENADIFVFPTSNDAFPLVTLEAMLYSLPVVSTFEGSIPDIVINNETGFLIEKGNSAMLAEKLSILIKDKPLRLEMGRKGHERFTENYTLTHFENNMASTFNSVLSLHSK